MRRAIPTWLIAVFQWLMRAIVVVILIASCNFALIRAAPGDPAIVLAGESGATDARFIASVRNAYGLDRSLPEQFGLYVASLARPGGNVTGVSLFTSVLVAKRIALLHELLPNVSTIAFLSNPTNPAASTDVRVVEAAAKSDPQGFLLFDDLPNQTEPATGHAKESTSEQSI